MHLLRPTKREYLPASKSSRGVRRGGGGGGGWIQHRKSSAREGMCGCAAGNTDRKYGWISSRPSNLHTGNKQIENHTRGMRWGSRGRARIRQKPDT